MAKSVGSVDASAEPALGFSYSIQLDDKKSIVLQTFLPRSATLPELNKILDIMGDAAARQAARALVKQLQKSLMLQTKQLRRVTEDLVAVDSNQQIAWKAAGKNGPFKHSDTQEAHRKSVLPRQERFREELEELKREIAEQEAILKGD